MSTKTTKPRQTKDTKAKQPSATEPKRASATKGKGKASAKKEGSVAPEQPALHEAIAPETAPTTSPATEPGTQPGTDTPVLVATKPATKPTRSKATKAKPAPTSPKEPTASPTATKPSKKPAPASMPRSKPALPAQDAAKPWLAKVTDATLADAASGFLAAIEAEGASEATISGYRRELKVALGHFGADRLLALIAPHEVAAFNESPAVMIARDGAPKAEPSFMRTRRVLRLALCWAVEQGLLETAPLPAKAPRKSNEPAATAS